MKPVSDLLHRTPWWALLAGGFALLVGLGVFVTPFHVIRLSQSGATPEENRAIKREIDSTFSARAIDMARGIVREMRNRAHDPARREELDRALEEIEQARESVQEAGHEAQQARVDAADEVASAMREAEKAIDEAHREAAEALKSAGAEKRVQESLQKSLEAARKAHDEMDKARSRAGGAPVPALHNPVEVPPLPGVSPPDLPKVEVPALPADLRERIHENVTGDLYRIGVGSGLILFFIPLFILAVVSKIFIDRSRAAQTVAEAKRREADYHRMSRQVTEAKLAALQAQVEPHFLYNTLASVQALTEVDPQRANAMTGHLIQYLRSALPKMRESVSTVGQEVELVRAYLNILQMRMGKRLAFEISVPPELAEAPFPPLMLPSLVENAIKHGLEPQREGGTVTIAAHAADGKIRIVVADTGRGFADIPGEGVGLANIRERLQALHGDDGRLTLEADEPHGVRATIEVPREPAPREPRPSASPAPEAAKPRGPAMRTLAAMGAAERAWRKSLSFAFIVLVLVAAVCAGLAVVGVTTGIMPVRIGELDVDGATGAVVGTAAIALAFLVIVLALALVIALVYGLGFVLVAVAIFVPVAILISLFPAAAPFILVGLGVWWLVRRNRAKEKEAQAIASPAPPPPTP